MILFLLYTQRNTKFMMSVFIYSHIFKCLVSSQICKSIYFDVTDLMKQLVLNLQ